MALPFSSLYRYKSPSAGCGSQTGAEGARRGYGEATQPSGPQSQHHSGHMDGKMQYDWTEVVE